MTEQDKQTIREAMADLIRLANSEGYEERADNATRALALLDAEPPQAEVSAEELYTQLDCIARDFDGYEMGLPWSDEPKAKGLSVIAAHDRAQLEKAAERFEKEADFIEIGQSSKRLLLDAILGNE